MTIEYKDSKRIVTSPAVYKVHTFLNSTDNFQITAGSGDVEYLVIAGGGGGGNGGGGAGGYLTGTSTLSTSTGSSGTHTVTVGTGGAPSNNGVNSVFNSITSTGGGAGNGGNGGSGGGGQSSNPAGSGIVGQGYAGGNGSGSASDYGGGGGGAGVVGTTGSSGGQGGNGSSSDINGTATFRAGGGGGGSSGADSAGGTGGGGIGKNYNGTSGTTNTGSGGGGNYSGGSQGSGGSGIVIVKYNSNDITATGGTITDVSVVQTKPTDVQDNSILVEKDTARRYWFDDSFNKTGLKAYWKFNETSPNDIVNQAGTVGSTDSIGTGANLQVTGATYDVDGKITKALSFDGTNDYALAGSSLSQWNFAHSTTATSTIVAWILSDVDQAEKVIFDDSIALQGGGTTVQSGVTFETRSVNKLGYTVRNTSGQTITQLITTANIYPDNTNYFMACVTYDHNLSSDNLKISVNDGTRQTATKSANTPTNGNANGVGTVASRSRLNTGFLNGNICEMSIWNRVLTDAEITALYNSGTGKTIDTVKGATWTYPPHIGQIAQLSGSSASNTYTAASEFYTISTDVWDTAFNLSGGARARAGSAGSTEHAYLLGGQDGSSYYSTIDKVAWADETNTTISRSTRAWGGAVQNAVSVCVGQSYYSGSYQTGINEYTYGTMAETSQGNTSSSHAFGGSFGNSTYGFVVNGQNTGIERYTYSDKSKTSSGFTASPTTTKTGGHTGNSTTGISINNTVASGNARYDSYNISADTWTTGSATSSTPYENGRASASTKYDLFSTQTNTGTARQCEKYNYSSGALSSFTSVATNLDGGDNDAGASSTNIGVNS